MYVCTYMCFYICMFVYMYIHFHAGARRSLFWEAKSRVARTVQTFPISRKNLRISFSSICLERQIHT